MNNNCFGCRRHFALTKDAKKKLKYSSYWAWNMKFAALRNVKITFMAIHSTWHAQISKCLDILTVLCATFNDVSNKGSTTSLTVRSSNVPIDDIEDLFLACSPIPPKLILTRNALKTEETYSRLLNKACSWEEDFFFFLSKAASVICFR